MNSRNEPTEWLDKVIQIRGSRVDFKGNNNEKLGECLCVENGEITIWIQTMDWENEIGEWVSFSCTGNFSILSIEMNIIQNWVIIDIYWIGAALNNTNCLLAEVRDLFWRRKPIKRYRNFERPDSNQFVSKYVMLKV